MRILLLEYLRFRGDDLVSRQAIENWLSSKSNPKRVKAWEFIAGFMDDRISYERLSEDQKKVFNQAKKFVTGAREKSCRAKSQRTASNTIYAGDGGSIVIQQPLRDQDLDIVAASWEGLYITFRKRLLNSKSTPIAREVVRLKRRGNEIRYQHWHQKEGVTLSSFEGNAIISLASLWLIGCSKDELRYRICHFKRNESENPLYGKLRWGLMHSDIPNSVLKDPASTRIVMVKITEPPTGLQGFLEETVRYIGETDLDVAHHQEIARCVDNSTSGASHPGTARPVEREDPILCTSQATLDAILLSMT